MPIVWEHADGHVTVTRLTESWLEKNRQPEETTDQAVLRLAEIIKQKTLSLADAAPTLVKEVDLPADDGNDNGRWRFRAGKLVVDTSIVRPPSRADRIAAATTLAQLKAALLGD